MNRRGLCLVIAIAACKRDHPCEKLADLVDKCTKEKLPKSTIDDIELRCRIDLHDRASGPQAMGDCQQAKTCEEQTACFEKWGCQFILTGPDDKTPQIMCRPGPGSGPGSP